MEVSSYQLQYSKLFRSKHAAILNISPDHLERHKNIKNYRNIKSRIFLDQKKSDYSYINMDNKLSHPLKKIFKNKKVKSKLTLVNRSKYDFLHKKINNKYFATKGNIENMIFAYKITKNFKIKEKYSHTKFIDLCILSGCDYLPYVPNLAINTVYSLFKKYDKIEDIIKLDKYKFADEYNDETLTLVRNIFNNFNYETPKILEKKLVNKVEFKNFLESNNIKNNYRILEKF